jgi:hypothetical protein
MGDSSLLVFRAVRICIVLFTKTVKGFTMAKVNDKKKTFRKIQEHHNKSTIWVTFKNRPTICL